MKDLSTEAEVDKIVALLSNVVDCSNLDASHKSVSALRNELLRDLKPFINACCEKIKPISSLLAEFIRINIMKTIYIATYSATHSSTIVEAQQKLIFNQSIKITDAIKADLINFLKVRQQILNKNIQMLKNECHELENRCYEFTRMYFNFNLDHSELVNYNKPINHDNESYKKDLNRYKIFKNTNFVTDQCSGLTIKDFNSIYNGFILLSNKADFIKSYNIDPTYNLELFNEWFQTVLYWQKIDFKIKESLFTFNVEAEYLLDDKINYIFKSIKSEVYKLYFYKLRELLLDYINLNSTSFENSLCNNYYISSNNTSSDNEAHPLRLNSSNNKKITQNNKRRSQYGRSISVTQIEIPAELPFDLNDLHPKKFKDLDKQIDKKHARMLTLKDIKRTKLETIDKLRAEKKELEASIKEFEQDCHDLQLQIKDLKKNYDKLLIDKKKLTVTHSNHTAENTIALKALKIKKEDIKKLEDHTALVNTLASYKKQLENNRIKRAKWVERQPSLLISPSIVFSKRKRLISTEIKLRVHGQPTTQYTNNAFHRENTRKMGTELAFIAPKVTSQLINSEPSDQIEQVNFTPQQVPSLYNHEMYMLNRSKSKGSIKRSKTAAHKYPRTFGLSHFFRLKKSHSKSYKKQNKISNTGLIAGITSTSVALQKSSQQAKIGQSGMQLQSIKRAPSLSKLIVLKPTNDSSDTSNSNSASEVSRSRSNSSQQDRTIMTEESKKVLLSPSNSPIHASCNITFVSQVTSSSSDDYSIKTIAEKEIRATEVITNSEPTSEVTSNCLNTSVEIIACPDKCNTNSSYDLNHVDRNYKNLSLASSDEVCKTKDDNDCLKNNLNDARSTGELCSLQLTLPLVKPPTLTNNDQYSSGRIQSTSEQFNNDAVSITDHLLMDTKRYSSLGSVSEDLTTVDHILTSREHSGCSTSNEHVNIPREYDKKTENTDVNSKSQIDTNSNRNIIELTTLEQSRTNSPNVLATAPVQNTSDSNESITVEELRTVHTKDNENKHDTQSILSQYNEILSIEPKSTPTITSCCNSNSVANQLSSGPDKANNYSTTISAQNIESKLTANEANYKKVDVDSPLSSLRSTAISVKCEITNDTVIKSPASYLESSEEQTTELIMNSDSSSIAANTTPNLTQGSRLTINRVDQLDKTLLSVASTSSTELVLGVVGKKASAINFLKQKPLKTSRAVSRVCRLFNVAATELAVVGKIKVKTAIFILEKYKIYIVLTGKGITDKQNRLIRGTVIKGCVTIKEADKLVLLAIRPVTVNAMNKLLRSSKMNYVDTEEFSSPENHACDASDD